MNPQSAFINSCISHGILAKEESRILLDEFKNDAFAVLTHLVRSGGAEKNLLGKLWGDSLGVAYVNLDETLFQPEALERMSEKFARSHQMIPLYQIGDTYTVAVADPKGQALEEAEKEMKAPVSPVFSLPDEIEDAIEIQYKSNESLEELVANLGNSALLKNPRAITIEQLRELSGDQAVVQMVRGLLLLAVKEGASDIHIEPQKDHIRLRFRIDGVIQDRKITLESTLLAPVVSRLKIMADLDITIRRRPQDGNVSLPLQKRNIEFRFSSIPTIYGEKVVLRVLSKIQKRSVPNIYELNLSAGNLNLLKKAIGRPHGIFLVTGPTGSGKSTTLFSILSYLNQSEVNIVTIEDPVEYKLPGINQVQTDPGAKLDFAAALRAYLRQDPDVILVGEIRDLETARIACQAALTGHQILASMHTNSASQALTRLIEIGVEPFMVAPSIIGALSQRLARRICEKCRAEYFLSPKKIRQIFKWDGKRQVKFYRGEGCPACKTSGFAGRLAVHEIFSVNSLVRELIAKNASIVEIEKAARNTGYQNMRYDGLKKVLRGLTTIEELDRLVPED